MKKNTIQGRWATTAHTPTSQVVNDTHVSAFLLSYNLKHNNDCARAETMPLSCQGAPNCVSQREDASPSQRHQTSLHILSGRITMLSQRQRRFLHIVAGKPCTHKAHPHEAWACHSDSSSPTTAYTPVGTRHRFKPGKTNLTQALHELQDDAAARRDLPS